MDSASSTESDLSNDAYVNLISTNWGHEEGELRQAIYFQFIKKDAMAGKDSFYDASDLQERILDTNSIVSDPERRANTLSKTKQKL